jgi:hypothetical protein
VGPSRRPLGFFLSAEYLVTRVFMSRDEFYIAGFSAGQ